MALRVLFLTCHLPFPPVSGGRRREYELLRRVAQHVDISLRAVSKTYEEDAANAKELERFCSDVRVMPAERLAPPTPAVPLQVLRHRASGVRDHLVSGSHDIVHVEGFYLMQHVRRIPGRSTLLVEQNIEYQLWEQRAAHGHGPVAWRHRREAERTRRAELAAWRDADVVAAITEQDRAVIAAAGVREVGLVPDGIDRLPPPRNAVGDPPTVTFVANFGYEPNVDAAIHFVSHVAPEIVAHVPRAQFMVVGNDPPDDVRRLVAPNITVTGRVPDVAPYIANATVVVCPLRIGGGVKVKMLEALSHGKAIVSTSVGMQGFTPAADEAVVVADDASAMAIAVAQLLTDSRRRRELESAAYAYASTLPTWDDAAAALLMAYEHASTRERLDA